MSATTCPRCGEIELWPNTEFSSDGIVDMQCENCGHHERHIHPTRGDHHGITTETAR